jgi:hypothetical protein
MCDPHDVQAVKDALAKNPNNIELFMMLNLPFHLSQNVIPEASKNANRLLVYQVCAGHADAGPKNVTRVERRLPR